MPRTKPTIIGGAQTTFGPDGAPRVEVRVTPNLHRTPDGALVASLADQITSELGAEWIACIISSSGRAVIRPSRPGIEADKMMQALLLGVAMALNHHECRDGHWVTALNLADYEVAALWRDHDGDLHCRVDYIDPPVQLAKWTDVMFASEAAEALDIMEKTHKEIGARKVAQIRRALGEKSANPRFH